MKTNEDIDSVVVSNMKINEDFVVVSISPPGQPDPLWLKLGFINEAKPFTGWEVTVKDIRFPEEKDSSENHLTFEYSIDLPVEFSDENVDLPSEDREELNAMVGESILTLILDSIEHAEKVIAKNDTTSSS